MRDFTFSSAIRRAIAAGVSVLAMTSAACSDAVTEPKPVVNVQSPSSDIIITPVFFKTATLKVTDVAGNLLPESAVIKIWTSPTDSIVFGDNATKYDLDQTTGKVKLVLSATGYYKACVWGWAINYMAEKNPAVYPTCANGVVNGSTVDFGTLFMRRKARIAFYTQMKNGTLIPGATIQMTPPNGFIQYSVADGGASPLDYDQTVNGVIQFKSSAGAGVHNWCETVAPTGFALASPNCGSLDAKFEQEYAIVLKHKAL